MNKNFNNGVWPVMLTPFTENNKIDYPSLERLVNWYIENGAAGLFADCQSSEMFSLSLEERVELARFIKEKAAGRVPVIASGHVSDSIEKQAKELNAVAETGVDAVILLSNRLAAEEESDEIWLDRLKKLLDLLPEDLPLGFYECPYPYKRVIAPELLEWCAKTGRFYFIKDTSCDIHNMEEKLKKIRGTQLKLFNANSGTLLESLKLGGNGFSGVMANFHADLYTWLCNNYEKEPEKARILGDFLTVASMIERQVYPVNAKYFQKDIGNFKSIHTRTKPAALLNETAQHDVDQLTRFTEFVREKLGLK